jgi:hypothetical protein
MTEPVSREDDSSHVRQYQPHTCIYISTVSIEKFWNTENLGKSGLVEILS